MKTDEERDRAIAILRKYPSVYKDTFSWIEERSVIDAMKEYASAEVEKNLREELMRFINSPFILNSIVYGNKEKAIDEYLKSREK